jgi:hypothetical protein
MDKTGSQPGDLSVLMSRKEEKPLPSHINTPLQPSLGARHYSRVCFNKERCPYVLSVKCDMGASEKSSI